VCEKILKKNELDLEYRTRSNKKNYLHIKLFSSVSAWPDTDVLRANVQKNPK